MTGPTPPPDPPSSGLTDDERKAIRNLEYGEIGGKVTIKVALWRPVEALLERLSLPPRSTLSTPEQREVRSTSDDREWFAEFIDNADDHADAGPVRIGLLPGHIAILRAVLADAESHSTPSEPSSPLYWRDRCQVAERELARLSTPSEGGQGRVEEWIAKLRVIARECGYAVGVHGSLKRDLDLIAVPWQDSAVPAEALIERFIEEMPMALRTEESTGIPRYQNPEQRPHGRLSWALDGCPLLYVDLAVFPRAPSQTGVEGEEWRFAYRGQVHRTTNTRFR